MALLCGICTNGIMYVCIYLMQWMLLPLAKFIKQSNLTLQNIDTPLNFEVYMNFVNYMLALSFGDYMMSSISENKMQSIMVWIWHLHMIWHTKRTWQHLGNLVAQWATWSPHFYCPTLKLLSLHQKEEKSEEMFVFWVTHTGNLVTPGNFFS